MKRMKLKNNKRKKIKYKILLLFFIFIFTVYLVFKYLVSLNININNKEIVKFLLYDYNKEDIVNKKLKENLTEFFMPDKLLNMKLVYKEEKESQNTQNNNPIVYIYNTHETEEYAKTTLAEYSVTPTVGINNYIMEDIFNENGIKTNVEEGSITDIRRINGWNYSYSYKASRVLIDEARRKNSSLKYFIDIHRDSLTKDKTTIEINNESYAKILFIVGLENEGYERNLNFTEQINNIINERYPGLSKGIYKKKGPGVNGVYNQDVSPYSILIEIGGMENNVDEVIRTTVEVSKIISEVILKNENEKLS